MECNWRRAAGDKLGRSVVISFRWHANKKRILASDILMYMENKSGNNHERAIVFGPIDFIYLAIGRRIWPVIVQNYLDLPATDENPIVVQTMATPAFDFPRPNGELINISKGRRMKFPGRVENLAQRGAFIGQSACGTNFYTVYQVNNWLTGRCGGLAILLCRIHHSSALRLYNAPVKIRTSN